MRSAAAPSHALRRSASLRKAIPERQDALLNGQIDEMERSIDSYVADAVCQDIYTESSHESCNAPGSADGFCLTFSTTSD